MAKLASTLNLERGNRILDLGGQPEIWELIQTPLEIVIMNLPGIAHSPPLNSHHNFIFIEGDACNADDLPAGQFDAVFSNSVIEHVGGKDKQEEFSSSIRSYGAKYWVQTPSIWFPLEAHTGIPFWFIFPEKFRSFFIERWRVKIPKWTEMVEGTTVISKHRLLELFPDAHLYIEKKFFIHKSYIMYRD